jgi:hypothetical protein
MKIWIAALLVLSIASLQAQTTVASFNDIKFWVGSGTNRSAVVLDFQDGSQKAAFAWGYRYNGPQPSGARMLLDVDAADTNLSLVYSGTAGANFFISEASYFDGAEVHAQTGGDFQTNFEYWGYFVAGGTAYDSYQESSLLVQGGGTNLPSLWLESPCGASEISFGSPGRFIADLSWDAWVFGEYGVEPAALVYPAAGAGAPATPKPQPSIRVTSSEAVVSVQSQIGFDYRLAYSGHPGGVWTNELSFREGDGSSLTFTNNFVGGTLRRFFRVVVSPR